MSSVIDKQRYVLKIQGIKSSTSFLLLLVGWLAFSRLLHMSEIGALFLTITLTVLFGLKLFLTYSEMVRRSLLNLQALENDSFVSKFSRATNKRLTYVVGGIVIWTVVSLSLLPHIESAFIRYALIAIFPLSLILYSPTLQLVQYWEVSKSGDVVNPTPLKFLSMFAPTSILSLLSAAFLFAGIVESIILGNPLYLAPGTVCAVLLFIFARKSAKRLVSKYAVELPN